MKATAVGSLPADPKPYLALAARLGELAEAGESHPCAGSALPSSDRAEDRQLVIDVMCPRCPVIDECRSAGLQEAWGVWGGVDVDPKAQRAAQAA